MARFMRKGTTKVYFVPTIAATDLEPTVAECGAGTALHDQIAEINGFSFKNNPIQTPDMGNRYTTQVPGEDTADDSNIVFYEDAASNPIRTALPKDETGYIAIFYAGIPGAAPAAGDDCEVWPITVASVPRQYSAGNEAAKWTAYFSITGQPNTDAVVQANP